MFFYTGMGRMKLIQTLVISMTVSDLWRNKTLVKHLQVNGSGEKINMQLAQLAQVCSFYLLFKGFKY